MTDFSFQPDSPVTGHFLEETAIIDWQTPRVYERARTLAEGCANDAERVRRAFAFVRDQVSPPAADATSVSCTAGQVLRDGVGLSFAKAHLLAALLRAVGLPTGFLYQRVHTREKRVRHVLYGLAAVELDGRWLPLDAGGPSPLERADAVELDLEAPCFAHVLDPEAGERTFSTLFSKPSRRVLDLLQRTPGVAQALAHRPDAP